MCDEVVAVRHGFAGVPVSELLARAKPREEAQYALIHAEPDYTTNQALSDLDREQNLIAYEAEGRPLEAEHGGPVRLVVPHLYFRKSAKWVTGIQLLREDYPRALGAERVPHARRSVEGRALRPAGPCENAPRPPLIRPVRERRDLNEAGEVG